MRKLLIVAMLAAAYASLGGVARAAATGKEAQTLAQPRPSWYTEELEAQVPAADPKGVEGRAHGAAAVGGEPPRHLAAGSF